MGGIVEQRRQVGADAGAGAQAYTAVEQRAGQLVNSNHAFGHAVSAGLCSGQWLMFGCWRPRSAWTGATVSAPLLQHSVDE
ncbi:hypothetical protein LMG27177_03861 [Paraburkholderia fynbosensis]|uniref:Uncharacterized protein n=1 Tax=Paraburkholderia fynbosensis TaxID=1200993 RepID=A0A6J5GBG0_9BURK|nr:hypothetical protein LMG27177_03861 [Paraburkholderia fynbosensis]